MARSLNGKVAVVTGATRGIGRGVARELGGAGAVVYVTGRTSEAAGASGDLTVEAAAREVTRLGGTGIAIACDHGDDAAVARAFAQVADNHGHIDILVNNVFKIPEPPVFGGKFWEHPIQIWDDMVGIGCRAHYVASVHAAPLMIDKPGGLIANISSRAGGGYVFSTAYGVGKCAVDRMAADMAYELTEHDVAVVSLWPSAVTTEFITDAVARGDYKIDYARAQSPEFTGRAITALYHADDRMAKSGQVLTCANLGVEYGFTDTDGRQPRDER
ncbi:MAG: SDR family NAD(P)-dependent oxidoreductase [Pseudomonadota bacterium]